jgi:hypothetical protein
LKKEDKEKVVIPQYVADWYEVSKDDFERELFLSIAQVDDGIWKYDLEFAHWLDTVSNNPIETLISMKKYGYEVEKKITWIVSIKKGESYFARFLGSDFSCVECVSENNAYMFDCEEKAEAVAVLVNGEVVKHDDTSREE